MLRGVMSRISTLERLIRIPVTADIFWTRVNEHARRDQTSVDGAVDSLVRELSDQDLDCLTEESEQLVFGSDVAARDDAKRRALMLVDPGMDA